MAFMKQAPEPVMILQSTFSIERCVFTAVAWIFHSRVLLFCHDRSFVRLSTPSSDFAFDGGDTIRVLVRVRPMNETEATRGDQVIVRVTDDQTAVRLIGLGGDDGGSFREKEYRFNLCCNEEIHQDQFFNVCGIKNLLDSALMGYAATVFAYGQTGSGKTYTMSGLEEKISHDAWVGDESTDGLVPRSLRYLFDEAERLRQTENVRYTSTS